jgi:hypothetical protein
MPLEPVEAERRVPARHLGLAVLTGLTIFLLEVAWFRSVRAAYQSTTETFGVLLGAFLVALSMGAALASRVRARAPGALGAILSVAAIAIWCATPVIEQLDRWAFVGSLLLLPAWRLLQLTLLIGPPVALLGMVLPWLLETGATSAAAGALYAWNTVGAVAGALGAAFVLLPAIGAVRTGWLAGGLVLAGAVVMLRGGRARMLALGLGGARACRGRTRSGGARRSTSLKGPTRR